MKILHVLLSRGFAGSERSTAESCNAQCDGHEVTLALRRDHRNAAGASIVDHLDPRVLVVELPKRLFTGWRLARLIRQWRPDVVHCHLRRATRLVAQIAPDAATVATLHVEMNSPHYLRMDGLICNARWQQRDIPAGYGGLVFKAHNSLTPHRRLAPAEIEAIRAGLGIGPQDFFVGGVGRLTVEKGWDQLIDAVKRLRHLPRIRVVIFGTGSARERFERQAADDARITVGPYRTDIKDVYQAMDVFVCPSRFEPLPRVMLEAMDAGVPVIASTAEGCRELVEDYGGDLFAIDDVPALATLIERHAQAGRTRTAIDLGAHHVPRANTAMLDFYQRVVAQRRPR